MSNSLVAALPSAPNQAVSASGTALPASASSTVQINAGAPGPLNPVPLLTATGVLLAFLIGLYTLIGRERKSPYLINTLFEILWFCVITAICSVLALFTPIFSVALFWVAAVSLVIALALTLWRVHKMYIRFALFVDSGHPKQLYPIRWLKHFWRRASEKRPYEWNAPNFSDALQGKIRDVFKAAKDDGPLLSAAISLKRHGRANQVLADLAVAFLKDKLTVQYMTASRHPLDFLLYLKVVAEQAGIAWKTVAEKIVVVDAYTKHFGYADSVYLDATTTLKKDLGVLCVRSGESFAGLHTASSKAFNMLQKRAHSNVRDPALVIYEDCYAIADLESREQYRVFIRHVIPSERMWGGMFTVFAETAQEKSDWDLLSAYCDIAIDDNEQPQPGAA